MFIMIKPLKPVSFRWGGEFSPTLSGPMNKGVSEPLPLPSTIAGFIYSITHGGGKREDLTELSLEKESVKVKLWGPLLYHKGKYYAHSYPGKLIELDNWELKLNEDGKVEEVEAIDLLGVTNKIGIGIKFDSKSVIDKLLYTQQLIKIEGGIIVEVEQEVKEGYYTMGGESSIVKVEPWEFAPPESGKYGLVISPIILSPIEKVISVDDLYDAEIEGCGKLGDVIVKGLPVKIGLIGLGFNIAYNVRRPIYPAILPGSVLKCNKRGNVGKFTGWGSILPVKVRTSQS
ncbi:MAG: hypothetical protein RQ863_05930 [Sulfolobales archaeon]|jgi:CRISPR-associated protein Cmr3|nr:hypothetical protein [Sulfolobales archaeon]